MSEKLFLDTCALLDLQLELKDIDFVISSVSLKELESIKVSIYKDNDIKYKARRVVHILDEIENNYEIVVPNKDTNKIVNKFGLEITPDNLIIACAYQYNLKNEIIFITNDLCCKKIANDIFKLTTRKSKPFEDKDQYKGFKEVNLTEIEMSKLYEFSNVNNYKLLTNEYLIVNDIKGNHIDKLKWNGEEFVSVKLENLKSSYFGTVKAYEGDIYQQCVIDSLNNNTITMIKGKPGSGKTYLSLGYLFYALEKHKIDKIVIFCNTIATVNSAKLGFYPGSKDEKLIDSSIGNILSSKLGDKFAVEELINDGKLQLMPMSDIRGFDTSSSSSKVGVYITEAQNMDITLMKLALQRIGDNSICIIDGDYMTQVDMPQYAGSNNGMRRASEVFRGKNIYGEVELINIYRSEIAKIAELM